MNTCAKNNAYTFRASGNGAFKGHLKELFSSWYAEQVIEQEKVGKIFRIDMKIAHLKPKHANWLVKAWSLLKAQTNVIKTGWEKTGISSVIM